MKNLTENAPVPAGKLFPAMLDALEEPLFVLDGELRLAWYNKASDLFYQSLSGKRLTHQFHFTELLTPEQAIAFREQLRRVLAGEKMQFEWNYCRAADKWLSVSLYPYAGDAGASAGVCGSLHDITARRRQEEERLQQQLSQQKEITRLMIQAQEAERNNLGRELHDNVNQLLAAASLQLSYCYDNYDRARPVIEECRENIQLAIDEIRQLTHKMVMPRFATSGLSYELGWLVAHYKHSHDIRLDATGWNGKGVPYAIKETLYRIAQEQLYNIQKHAKAGEVSVCIYTDDDAAHMSIHDNGVGFDPAGPHTGIGLTNIINRAEAWNGTAQFISAPGQGCRLLVRIPFR